MTRLVPTPVYPELLRYVGMAATLQAANMSSPTGRDTSIPLVDDPLCQWVTIYDVIERRLAGFSNALQQVRLGSANPKRWQFDTFFDEPHDPKEWTLEDWLYVSMVHRVTGSGASFAKDHGFRNSVINSMCKHGWHRSQPTATMSGYVQTLMRGGQAVFTSIGNQIPPFPKPPAGYDRGGEYYLHVVAPALCITLGQWLRQDVDRPAGIKRIVDWLGDAHRNLGFRRFEFVHTAFAMDLAEYHPGMVDPMSHCYFGANARKCAELCFDYALWQRSARTASGTRRATGRDAFHDAVMEQFQADVWSIVPDTPGFPMSLEDVLCDGIRWIRNYIPKGYEHLTPDQVQSTADPHLLGRHDSYTKHMELWKVKT